MVAKRSSRALALLLALPQAAFALGLGDIHLLSSLNTPLNAEIELVDVAPEEARTLQAQLASRDTFARHGLDYPGYLTGVQVHTVRTPDGRQLIKLKSNDPIADPFITLLVEVNWARGRLVREYTVLLDPPLYNPGQSRVASAGVSAPATGNGAREGAIERGAAAGVPGQAVGTAPAATPAPAEPAPVAPAITGAAAASASPAAAAGSAAGEYVVNHGETLSQIAAGVAGAELNSAHARSWMLAIYEANPSAFRQNMNVLRSGAVLRIPSAATAAAVSPSNALAEIRRQYVAWRGTEGAPAASAAAEPGRLKLVPPSEGASAAAGSSAGASAAANSAEVSALKGQIRDLQEQLAEHKRLLDMKDADLARLQRQLAAKQTPEPAPSAAPAAAPLPASAASPPETAPAQQVAPPREVSGGFFATLAGYWWVALLALLAAAALFGLRILRARRAAQLDDSLGRLAVAGAESGSGGFGGAAGGGVTRGFASGKAPVRATPPQAPESALLVEETGGHEPSRPLVEEATAAAARRHLASDERISSETVIGLDHGDPLAEADFHVTYGLYDQAADLIRIAITREPGRRDLKLKLLEVFFVWGNKEQFLQAARELAESRTNGAPGEWEKILIMGKQLAPEDPLFSGAGTVTGAAAGGVDLDLEGGQSRVDFDLLGEPVPADAPQGVDLDIGAAIGEHDAEAADATTGVTDRDVALLENTLPGATGTTHQLTVRLRPEAETVTRQGGLEQTAELGIDDLGLDVGAVDTRDQPGLASAGASTPDAPTLVAGLDEQSRKVMEDTRERAREETGAATGAWQFDQNELDAASAHSSLTVPDASATSYLAKLPSDGVDIDVGEATGTHPARDVDIDVGTATVSHAANGSGLDPDVGSATVPGAAFSSTQRLPSEDLALPDLEPLTLSEVGTKLDLARAYMDMGDPDGARNILEEVLSEGSVGQQQEARRLMESIP